MAKKENKPILVDVGAEWCHWCHVMDHENYDDPETARFINSHFTAVKVDRDERPDIDRRLQDAVASITGQGGWPLTVFLMPNGHPFFGGTYFPPKPRGGMPSFRQVLEHAASQFAERAFDLSQIGSAVVDNLNKASEASADETDLTLADVLSYTESVISMADSTNGGFGFAPKFPNPETLLFLLQQYCRTKDPKVLSCAEAALMGMARGGIYDHVGGGFHRYSTDPLWRVPHFEKLSHENAMLLRCYLQAFRITKKQMYKEISLGILRWLLDEMYDVHGGFYASQDADFNGGEGAYVGWTEEELLQALGPDNVPPFLETFGLEPLEGGVRKALYRRYQAIMSTTAEPFISQSLETLHDRRRQRGKAPTDTTVYTNWSCHCAIACLEAGMILSHESATKAGLNAIRMIMENRLVYGLPIHCFGKTQPLFSDDSVALCAGLITAYESTLHWEHIFAAQELADSILAMFQHPTRQGLADTNTPTLGIFQGPIWDFAQPGTNPLFSICLQKLALYCERQDFSAQAERIASIGAKEAGLMALHASTFFSAGSLLLYKIDTIIITGMRSGVITACNHGDRGSRSLVEGFHRSYLFQRAIITDAARTHSLLEGKPRHVSAPTAYVCKGTQCSTPLNSREALEQTLHP